MKSTATVFNRSLLAVAAFFLAAAPLAAQAKLQVSYPDGSECQPLTAGQHIEAGEVCTEVQGTNLAVTYNMLNEWELIEAHLWAGLDLTQMPANRRGNPKIGNFPYVTGDITGATSYTFTVPLETAFGSEEPCDVTGLLAGHAAVRKDNGDGSGYQTETGWIEGEQIIERGSWAMFSSVEFTCPVDVAPPPPDEEICSNETAYAWGDQTFIDLRITRSRWGWQITVEEGEEVTTPIYAGAGRNDITKGTEVGQLAVSYVNGEVTVTYLMSGDFFMKELHLYVGEDDLPRLAPGSYTVVAEDLDAAEYTYSVPQDAAVVKVVAHAVVPVCKVAE